MRIFPGIRHAAVLVGWLVAAACAGAAAPAGAPPGAPKANALYLQLGGYDAIAALTDDFIGRMLKDSTLAPFFAGLTKPELQRIRQMVVDQLCAATGGPCVYVGRDLKEVHQKLNISSSDWQAAVRDLNASLDQFHVGHGERNQVLAIVRTLEPEIVRSP